MSLEPQQPAAQRALTLAIVLLLHVGLLALLLTQSDMVVSMLPRVFTTHIIQAPRVQPPKPPEIKPPPPSFIQVPVPDVIVTPPPTQTSAPRAVVRMAPSGPPASHFGAADGDAGLGLDVATSAGGGVRGRGSLGDFDAAVQRAVLAHKHQPTLAWDVRNTCTINYTVTVARSGALAGLSIDECAIPEINAAARAAIRAAAPFPPPPDLGAATYDVHGTLIFHP